MTKSRARFPQRVRALVWQTWCGKVYSHKCTIAWCNSTMEILGAWHVAHVTSVISGGTDAIDNLRPVCGACNLSMGTQNLIDFEKHFAPSDTCTLCRCSVS